MGQQLSANTIIPNYRIDAFRLPFLDPDEGVFLHPDPVNSAHILVEFRETISFDGVDNIFQITPVAGGITVTNNITADQALSILYGGREIQIIQSFSMDLPAVMAGGESFVAKTLDTADSGKVFTNPLFLGVSAGESEGSLNDDVTVTSREGGFTNFNTGISTYEAEGFFTALFEEKGFIHNQIMNLDYSYGFSEVQGGVARVASIVVNLTPVLFRSVNDPTALTLTFNVGIVGSWSIFDDAMGTPVYEDEEYSLVTNNGTVHGAADTVTTNEFKLFEHPSTITPTIEQFLYRDNSKGLAAEVVGSLDIKLINPRGTDMDNW